MTQVSLLKGGTLLIPSGPSSHLHIVCGPPVFYPNLAKECVLLVCICSAYETVEFDTTCMLAKGDHPFVVRDSYVMYRKADIFGADSIKRKINEGEYHTHENCSSELIARVLDGCLRSPETRPKYKKFCEKYCFD